VSRDIDLLCRDRGSRTGGGGSSREETDIRSTRGNWAKKGYRKISHLSPRVPRPGAPVKKSVVEVPLETSVIPGKGGPDRRPKPSLPGRKGRLTSAGKEKCSAPGGAPPRAFGKLARQISRIAAFSRRPRGPSVTCRRFGPARRRRRGLARPLVRISRAGLGRSTEFSTRASPWAEKDPSEKFIPDFPPGGTPRPHGSTFDRCFLSAVLRPSTVAWRLGFLSRGLRGLAVNLFMRRKVSRRKLLYLCRNRFFPTAARPHREPRSARTGFPKRWIENANRSIRRGLLGSRFKVPFGLPAFFSAPLVKDGTPWPHRMGRSRTPTSICSELRGGVELRLALISTSISLIPYLDEGRFGTRLENNATSKPTFPSHLKKNTPIAADGKRIGVDVFFLDVVLIF